MKKECVAMLLAGGQGSRLYVLTGDMAKPAVPFGGKFRIIDFPLSNCIELGNRHGRRADAVPSRWSSTPISAAASRGSSTGSTAACIFCHRIRARRARRGIKGTANAIYQNIGFVDLYDPEYVAGALGRPHL